MKNAELSGNTFLNANYQKVCPICKKHMREHTRKDYKNCMKILSDEIKALPKTRQKQQEEECYLCIKGAPHNHDKPSACYLCLKNGKSIYFSDIEKSFKRWEEEILQPSLDAMPERMTDFITTSSQKIDRLYTPLDTAHIDVDRDIGFPGEYPYTRGIHPTMYRGRLWTMRMFAGFGMVEETNRRFKYLLEQGQTGLSTAFDLPTLYGYDSDSPTVVGEFGECGVGLSLIHI